MTKTAKPVDIRITEITECDTCPGFTCITDRIFICDKGQPKFVVSENGLAPKIIPEQCPLPKKRRPEACR